VELGERGEAVGDVLQFLGGHAGDTLLGPPAIELHLAVFVSVLVAGEEREQGCAQHFGESLGGRVDFCFVGALGASVRCFLVLFSDMACSVLVVSCFLVHLLDFVADFQKTPVSPVCTRAAEMIWASIRNACGMRAVLLQISI